MVSALAPKLEESFTLFLYSFKYADDLTDLLAHPDSKWERSIISPDPTCFFNYVNEFFANNQKKHGEIDPSQLVIYQVKSSNLNEKEKDHLFLYNSLISKNHSIDIDKKSIDFKFLKDKNILSPKILLLPFSNIGVFSFGISLNTSEADFNDFLNVNYNLRIFSSGKIQQIKSEKKDHFQAKNNEEKIALLLGSKCNISPVEGFHVWDINFFINYMLDEIKTGIRTLSPSRLQGFCFVEFNPPKNKEDINSWLFRTSRMYTENYQPSVKQLQDDTWMSQTFEGIYHASSVEGTAVLIESNNKPFYKNYKGIVIHRILWTFLLAYIQRLSLISLAEDNSHIYSKEQEPSIHLLEGLVEKISRVQLKCLFTEVSHISQQNVFYNLCLSQFRIDQLFQEIKEEVMEINQLIADRLRDRDEKVRSKSVRKLETLLGMLIIPQIWLALLSTNIVSWQEWINLRASWVGWTSLILWIAILMIIVKMFWKRNKQ